MEIVQEADKYSTQYSISLSQQKQFAYQVQSTAIDPKPTELSKNTAEKRLQRDYDL